MKELEYVMVGSLIPKKLSPSTPLMPVDSSVAARATAKYGLAFSLEAHDIAIKIGRKKKTAPRMESRTI